MGNSRFFSLNTVSFSSTSVASLSAGTIPAFQPVFQCELSKSIWLFVICQEEKEEEMR
jgi:hypothetical protein